MHCCLSQIVVSTLFSSLRHNSLVVHAGETEVKEANERSYVTRLNASYGQYKQERMLYADSECRQMITKITQQLTQVSTLPHLPSVCVAFQPLVHAVILGLSTVG